MTRPDRIFPGIALMLTFCALAPLIDVASKLASQAVPVGTVTLGRYVVQGLLMAPLVVALRLPLRIGGRVLALSVARAFVSMTATYCFVAAVQVMPIADALAIAFVEPFVILFIGRFVLHEEVGPRRLAAIARADHIPLWQPPHAGLAQQTRRGHARSWGCRHPRAHGLACHGLQARHSHPRRRKRPTGHLR